MAAVVFPVNAVGGAPSYTGRMLRQSSVSPLLAMGASSRPLGARSGVRPGTPPTIATATATTWTVTPFAGIIDGASAAIAGAYGYAFDTNQTGAVTAAGASARTDRLDVQVIDPAEGGVAGANPLIQVVYTVGTPGLAAAPAQSHPLAQINVPISGGGSPTVTWKAPYSAAAGAAVWFNTKAEMDAVTTMPDGTEALTLDKLLRFTSKGGVWQGALGPITAPTYNAAVWAAHSQALQFFPKTDGMIGVEGGFQNFGAGTFNAGIAAAKVGDIPAALRPSRTVIIPGSQLLPGGTTTMAHASLFIQADGQVFVSLSTTGTYGAGALQVFVAAEYRPA